MADLKEKVVLVTGAAGAIGAAVVAAVKRAGGTAIATDLAAGKGIDAALEALEASLEPIDAPFQARDALF